MDGLGIVLLIVVAAAIGALIAGLVVRKRQQRPPAVPAPQDPFADSDHHAVYGDPRSLKAGDLVELRGVSYSVRGSVRCDEGGWTWSEHLLETATEERVWLSVEEDPDLILVAWTEIDTELQPGPKTLTLDGVEYRSDEKGTATYTTEATTGLKDGSVRYHDYKSRDRLLSFESYGDAPWEAATGEKLSTYDVKIFPAANG
ncbi:DUF4178 domain-containing protein [Actinokineospora sp. UTMC 2448]|uniref:DUF4178 domain-containing protein n=1 Tax=Actinokineospora sp. UTMC 2448 TaxID=2268449 RepID=UPI002164731D|nr:DUF4178 domain-containing protein [Actinokineospora sp. UTMC 2448]UVS76718.1 hypothetical protein Actkin_00412 [Actinokineospora sp. UTMC 2448]